MCAVGNLEVSRDPASLNTNDAFQSWAPSLVQSSSMSEQSSVEAPTVTDTFTVSILGYRTSGELIFQDVCASIFQRLCSF